MTIDTIKKDKNEFLALQDDLQNYNSEKEADLLCQLVADTYDRMYLYDDNHKCTGAVVSYGDNCKIISTETYVSVYELDSIAVVRTFKAEEYSFIVNYFRDYFQFDAKIIEEEKILKFDALEWLRSRMLYDLKTHYSAEENKLDPIDTMDTLEDLDKISEMTDKLASKIDYNGYMEKYLKITGENEENFDEYFDSLVLDEVY